MGTPQGPHRRRDGALTAVVYLVLLLLGVLLAVIGSFQYSRGPVPLVAIVLDVAIFLTCVLGGWGMRSFLAGIIPAMGWLAAAFVLSMPNSRGTVIITATPAGEWFLYGGTLATAAGGATAFVLWARSRYRG